MQLKFLKRFFKPKADVAKTFVSQTHIAFLKEQSLEVFSQKHKDAQYDEDMFERAPQLMERLRHSGDFKLYPVLALSVKEHSRTWYAGAKAPDKVPDEAGSTSGAFSGASGAQEPLLPIQLEIAPRNVQAGPMVSVNSFEEKTLHLVLHRLVDGVFTPGVSVEFFQCPEKDRSTIKREFDRVAAQMLVSYGFAPGAPLASAAAQSPVRRGFIRASMPWLGGALLMFVLLMGLGSQKPARVAAAPGASADSKLSLAAPGVLSGMDFSDPALAAAWSGLTPEQQAMLTGTTNEAVKETDLAKGVSALEASVIQLSEAQLSEIGSAKHLLDGKSTDTDKVFYAFEDPMCSSCKSLSRETSKLRDSHSLRIIPVAYLKGSMDLASGALCSSNPTESWSRLLSGIGSSGAPCEDGYKQLAANNKLFESLGFDSTPTIVALNGRIRTGSIPAANLQQWLADNS